MIFRVSSEFYDMAWFIRTSSKKRAIKLVTVMTEELGWHLEFLDEPRDWECEEVFTKKDEIIESKDL